jgi:hypothetical protein
MIGRISQDQILDEAEQFQTQLRSLMTKEYF